MTLVVACVECSYGTLQKSNDPNGIELQMLRDIHNTTFKHHAEVRQATLEDTIKYTKTQKK